MNRRTLILGALAAPFAMLRRMRGGRAAERELDAIEDAWGVIANALDWDADGRQEWRAAAERWRDTYLGRLAEQRSSLGDRQVRAGDRIVTRVTLAPCPGCGQTIDLAVEGGEDVVYVNASDFHVCSARATRPMNVTVQNVTLNGWERHSFNGSSNA